MRRFLQVVQRGCQYLHAGVQAGERRDAHVVQAGGGRADDDDLAGEFVLRALRMFAAEVLIQLGIGNMPEGMGLAAPREDHVVLLRHRVAQVGSDARGQRRNQPAAHVGVEPVAPPHAVGVLLEVDRAAAPVARVDRQRRQQRDARLWVGALGARQPQHRRNPGERRAIGIQRRIAPYHREVDVVGRIQRLVEQAVALRAVLVAFAEQDVEHDCRRALRRDAAHQFAMHRTRPRPVAGNILHAREAGIVDVHDDDLRVGCQLLHLLAHEEIRQAVFQRQQRMQPAGLRHGQCEEQRGNAYQRSGENIHRGILIPFDRSG